jgi:hypothetical protein
MSDNLDVARLRIWTRSLICRCPARPCRRPLRSWRPLGLAWPARQRRSRPAAPRRPGADWIGERARLDTDAPEQPSAVPTSVPSSGLARPNGASWIKLHGGIVTAPNRGEMAFRLGERCPARRRPITRHCCPVDSQSLLSESRIVLSTSVIGRYCPQRLPVASPKPVTATMPARSVSAPPVERVSATAPEAGPTQQRLGAASSAQTCGRHR